VAAVEATGVRELAQPPATVWQALAVLRPYCSVCDVSYVADGPRSRFREGATFTCVPGRRDGDAPVPSTGTPGRIVEWAPPRVVVSELRPPGETWTTRIELTAADGGGTSVEITLRREQAGSALAGFVQRKALRRLVQRTLEAELDKLPAHVAQVTS
jgi:Polyketide cyclase / dehydrase and lipid transport